MREFARGFYNSMPWKRTRADYMKQHRNLCEKCLAKGLIVPAEVVHHKIHLTPQNITDEAITLDHNNLIALCKKCHAEEHADIYVGRDFHNAKRIKKRYTIGDCGKVTAR